MDLGVKLAPTFEPSSAGKLLPMQKPYATPLITAGIIIKLERWLPTTWNYYTNSLA